MNKDKQVIVCTGSMKTQVKKLRCEAIKPSSRSLFEEKVYDVSRTSPQHLVGVSKTNKKLTSVLKKETSSY